MSPLLVGLVLAGTYEVASDTTVQVRGDALGAVYALGHETLRAAAGTEALSVEGYGELGFPEGFDERVGGELFLLSVDGLSGPVRWSVGRQRVELPVYGRFLDGARGRFTAAPGLTVDAWAGLGRHVGLDGVTAGAPAGRLALDLRRGAFAGTLGAWGELGDTAAFHPDLALRWSERRSRLAPDLQALGALGLGGGDTVLERGRIEASARPLGGVRAMAWVEHRGALPSTSPLGPSILASFAPDGADEVGLGAGWTDARRSQLWVQGGLQRYAPAPDAAPGQGLSAEVGWRPACGDTDWCLVPSWRAASGPGGVYQAFAAAVDVPLPEPVALRAHGMIVPYHKPYRDWDTALVLGGRLSFAPGEGHLAMELGGEVARTEIAPLDPRGWATLRLEAP